MSLSNLTFKFYTDSGLTSAFSGTESLVNLTDLSDNPQSFVLYFGSASSSARYLRTVTSPGTNQIILTPTDIAATWIAATSYIVGYQIEPTVSNGYVYICTTAGTSHASVQPTWPTSINSTVTDGTVVWTCYAVKHATTEIRLSLTGGSGLTGATAGAALNIGTVLQNGTGNAIPIYFSVTNAVTTVNSNVGYPQLGININNVQETTT